MRRNAAAALAHTVYLGHFYVVALTDEPLGEDLRGEDGPLPADADKQDAFGAAFAAGGIFRGARGHAVRSIVFIHRYSPSREMAFFGQICIQTVQPLQDARSM